MTEEKREHIELIFKNLEYAILCRRVNVAKSYLRDLRINIGLEARPEYLTEIDVQDAVCAEFNITGEDLIKPKKNKYTIPRFALIYIWRTYFKKSISEITEALNIRNHSMVIYARNRVEEWLEYDRDFIEKMKLIIRKCEEYECRTFFKK